MSKNLEIYNKINIVLFSILILFIYFLILYDFPYYLVKAATDSGYEYLSDSLSVYAGQSQIRYNHPGFIPILLGSFFIKFFINDNFNPQNFINLMVFISYLFLIFSFYFLIKFYKNSSLKFFIYPIILTCFLWPPLIGAYTTFSVYSFLPSFLILFMISFLNIFQKKNHSFINFSILSLLSVILITTHTLTITLVFFIYIILFFQILKNKNNNYKKGYFLSIFLLFLLCSVISFIEPKFLIPIVRLFIQFFYVHSYSFLNYSEEHSALAKLVYILIELKFCFLTIFFLTTFLLVLKKFSEKKNYRKKSNNSVIYILIFLFFFYIIVATPYGYFIKFDNSLTEFIIYRSGSYSQNYNQIFLNLKLSSFIGIFLIFFFINLFERNKSNFNYLYKNKFLFNLVFLALYSVLFFSFIDTHKKIKKNKNAIENLQKENSEFLKNTFPDYNLVAHSLFTKDLIFGPNTKNFILYNSEKIKPLLKKNYNEISLNINSLPIIKSALKENEENVFRRYDAIVCDQKYKLLRNPNKIYVFFGTIGKKIGKKNCANLLYYALFDEQKKTFVTIQEFTSGKRLNINPKYLLIEKQKNKIFSLYNFENNKFSEFEITNEDILNEINNIYKIENYKIVELRDNKYIAITLK